MNNFRPVNTMFPPVIKNLIIINFLIWLGTLALQRYGIDLVHGFGLHYWRSDEFNVMQFITYMFLHDPSSVWHVFFNMFSLWMFGKDIEVYWGGKRFLIYYFATGIGAGLVQQLAWVIDLYPMLDTLNRYLATQDISVLAQSGYFSIPANGVSIGEVLQLKQQIYDAPVTIGASGAVFGVLLAFAMLFPQARIFMLFIPIPIRAPFFVAFYALCELYLGVHGSADGVAHYAHIGGMLFGLLLILYWKKKGKTY